MATHDKISVIRNINIGDAFLDTSPKQIQRLSLERADARHYDLSAFDGRGQRCVVVYIGFYFADACLEGAKGFCGWVPRGNYDIGRGVFQKILNYEMSNKPVASVYHDSRNALFESLETFCVQLVDTFQERRVVTQNILLLPLEERAQ